jgi:catechol 2,3-dioxygenase-like lactoylglutathione lyase family enzyme
MFTQLTHSQVYVLDQDEALDFYVGKLGLELNTDADLGFMRWLTVNVPGEPERELVLTKPGPPQHDDATAERIRELVTKGALGMAGIFRVDDVHKTY